MKYKTMKFKVIKRKPMKRAAIMMACCISLGLSVTALSVVAGPDSTARKVDSEMDQASHETNQRLIEGKVEGALLINEDLNNFDIDIDVNKNEVMLSGEVNSSAEKDLAEEVALSIDGVKSVDNQLQIAANNKHEDSEQEASAVIQDAAITAMVKTGLLTNSNISGTDINVETKQRVVTLKGKVESNVESDLAEKIAENTEDVKDVENELQVVAR